MIRQQLLLLPSVPEIADLPPIGRSAPRPSPDHGYMPGPGFLQGSQGLLQTLLDLGETFLASELSEVDLQDLEVKLSAAKGREHDAIRDLQKKIEELSGMSAMVTTLKNELKEEKEKAKEEAEDLTQEMAELRYQLMQRVDEERELRARAEEASLRRIAELEAQLKYSKQEASLFLAWKQSAEVQGQARTFELQHLKSALEEAKQAQNKLVQDREETVRKMEIECGQLQVQVTALQAELTIMHSKLKAADDKREEVEGKCRSLQEESERIQLSVDQKRAEVQLKAVEEGVARWERLHKLSVGENFEDLQSSEQQHFQLLQEVTEVMALITSFKLHLFVLASEYHEMEGRHHVCYGGGDSLQDNSLNLPPLLNSFQNDGSELIRDVACITDVKENDGNFENVQVVARPELPMIPDFPCLSNAEELYTRDLPCECDFDRHALSSPDHVSVAEIKEISVHEVSSHFETESDHASAFMSSGKSLRSQEGPWPVTTVVDLVNFVTEEMTKVLRILLKCPHQMPDSLHSLESRLQLWSNIPLKALPEKVVGKGVLLEWGEIVVDLLGQARRDLNSMQQRIQDLEVDRESLENMQVELDALSNEAMSAKEELFKAKMWFESELSIKEDAFQIIERKLEQSNRALSEAQTVISQQDISHGIVLQQLHKYEEEMKIMKALSLSEKKCLEASLANLHEVLQKERARASREADKSERMLEELRSRLTENEQELEALVQANDLDIGAVVAAKLRQLDQKLKSSQLAEAEVQAKCSELLSQVAQLQAKLEEAERELEAENEHHVEALIRYEEERDLLEAELEVGKQALHDRNANAAHFGEKELPSHGVMESCFAAMDSRIGRESPSRANQKQIEEFVEVLKRTILEKDQLLTAQKDDLAFQKELNKKLMNDSALLEAELFSVRQEILLYESQAADMESTIASLQEALLLETLKVDQAQADMEIHTKRQDEDYLHFKLRLDELLSNIKLMQSDLAESRRRESEAWAQVEKLDAELSLTKEHTKSLELRLQMSVKQLESQLDLERAKQREAQLRFLQQADEMKCLEGEKGELRRLLVLSEGECLQLERERDDFRLAYMELESQLSRKRGAFAR